MGAAIRLTGKADGVQFEAYHAPPGDARRGGLVMLHAIWGVTPHLRSLADDLADHGYEVIAPSLFDRSLPGMASVDIDEPSRERRLAAAENTRWSVTLGDVQAAIDALAGPVFVMGFCYGGTVAWMAAALCDGIAAAACFYGGGISRLVERTPKTPTILHFGKTDSLIPLADVELIEAAHPDLPVWLYDAGHAFMAPSDYDAASAKLARLRTLQHFHRNSGSKGEMGG